MLKDELKGMPKRIDKISSLITVLSKIKENVGDISLRFSYGDAMISNEGKLLNELKVANIGVSTVNGKNQDLIIKVLNSSVSI